MSNQSIISVFAELGQRAVAVDAAKAEFVAFLSEIKTIVKVAPMSASEKNDARNGFIDGYMSMRGASKDGARKFWERYVLPHVEVKQSARAKAAQEKRKAAKQATAPTAPTAPTTPAAPASGDKAGEVTMQLTADEIHLIKLIRAHRADACLDFLNKLLDKVAPV